MLTDTHNNIDSILSISDQKRSLSFTPFTFDEGKWSRQSIQYFLPETEQKKTQLFKREGKIYRDCTLEFFGDEEVKTIHMKNLEVVHCQKNKQKYLRLDDRTPMNYFAIGYDGPLDGSTYLYFQNSPIFQDFVDALLAYQEVKTFIAEHQDSFQTGWRIRNGKGITMVEGKGFPETKEYRFSKEFLLRLKNLENNYHVCFCVPQNLTEEDEHKITLLEELSDKGYTDSPAPETILATILSEENKEELTLLAAKPGPFYLKGKGTLQHPALWLHHPP